ncbi:MAG TPA: metallopeptidase TldD-related protein [Bdellovibrionota bacterium]|jgi:predicted Zn-dependent protease
MNKFVGQAKQEFQSLCDALFQSLKSEEDLTVNLGAENSLFVRFNGNRVRQNTNVEQLNLSLKFQSAGRTVEKSRTLSGNLETDRNSLVQLLEACRAEAKTLPEDPNQVPMQNNGQSNEEFQGDLLGAEAAAEAVVRTAEGSDLAGLYASGPVIAANRNSKNQSHWFATESFFLDYSLYNGPKAAKGVYAGARWNPGDWKANLERTKQQLQLLGKPAQNVKPGKYKTYLAPKAFADLIGMMSWGALSGATWKQGRSPFKKLADGEAKLSPLFSVRENFGLGLTPRFNSLGEVAPSTISLIDRGELRELLVSSRTAKEFGLKANAAGEGEGARSLEVLPGTLDEKDVLKELGTGLYLSNLHYLNWSDPVTARITGMTRYACFWVEGGEIAGPIKDLRWDESLYDALGSKLMALTSQAEIDPAVGTYFARDLGGGKVPGALIDQFTFTL